MKIGELLNLLDEVKAKNSPFHFKICGDYSGFIADTYDAHIIDFEDYEGMQSKTSMLYNDIKEIKNKFEL